MFINIKLLRIINYRPVYCRKYWDKLLSVLVLSPVNEVSDVTDVLPDPTF